MGKFIDLTGQKFGRLTVLERDTTRKGGVYWFCRCECGNVKCVRSNHLRSGYVKSCGCYQKEKRFKHGMAHTKIYQVWATIKERCLNPNCSNYKYYGSRGISIEPAWVNDFIAFYEYVSTIEHFGEKNRSLDRIDNNEGYCIGNLRWATASEQANNLRSNHLLKINGELMSLSEATRLTKCGRDTVIRRVSKNATLEQLFSENRITTRYFEINGEQMTVNDIVKKTGICYSTIYDRIRRGLNGADLLAPVKK